MPARLLFTLVCDDVREEKSEKLVVVGLYNRRIIFNLNPDASRPADASNLKFGLAQLCLVRRWEVLSPGQLAKTELIDPSGAVAKLVERELVVPASGDYHQEILRLHGVVLVAGKYIIRTTVGGTVYDEEIEVVVPQIQSLDQGFAGVKHAPG